MPARLLLFWAVPAAAVLYTPLPTPVNLATGASLCADSQYLDISSLQCLACSASDAGGQTLVPTDSGLSCRCASGVIAEVGGLFVCALCGDGEAASADGTVCMPCGGTTLGLVGSECACPSGEALLETNGHGALLTAKGCGVCGDAAYLNTASGRCVACPARYQTSTEVGCVCPSGYLEKLHADGLWEDGLGGGGVSCVRESVYNAVQQLDTPAGTSLTLSGLLGSEGSLTLTSKAFEQLLVPAATECLRAVQASTADGDDAPRALPLELGNAACQAVANLCVAQLYNENSAACGLFALMEAQSTLKAYSSPATLAWFKRLPWLAYDSAQVLALTAEVPLAVDLSGAASVLTYVLAAYTLNGTFLGLQPLTQQLQLCTGVAKNPAAFLKVGTALKVSCSLQVGALLLAAREPTYYDLYLMTSDATLYPVPVKITNLAANTDRSASNDRLVRRFFVADALTPRTAGSAAALGVRYLSDATLTVTLEPNLPTRILPPLLTLTYAQAKLLPSELVEGELATEAGVDLATTFRAEYTMDLSETSYGMTIFFILSVIAWVVGWLILLYMQMRRNKGQVVDGPYLVGAAAKLCRVFGDVFFFFLFGASGWMLIIYKEQDSIYVMMPLSEGPNASSLASVFSDVLVAVFIAKCVHIVELVWSQTRHDLFFIDWEQPKAAADKAEQGDDGADPSHGVSTWRTVFVANEWAQLQAARAVSLEVSLVCLLFFQQGLGLEDFSRLTPSGTGQPGVPQDLFLRFALSSFLLLALAAAQWLVRWGLWDRFVQDRVWQFVDLLSVTNVSCLLLAEQTYGYYLHGRSVHEHADTDMLQVML